MRNSLEKWAARVGKETAAPRRFRAAAARAVAMTFPETIVAVEISLKAAQNHSKSKPKTFTT